MAIAPNGAIVVGGEYREAGSGQTDDFAIARVNPGGGVQTRTTDIDGGDDHALSVAFNGFSGTIVLSGFSKPNPGVTHNEFAAVRLDSILQPDPSFNGTGAARVDFGTGAVANDVAVDSLFRIVQVGVANAGGGDDDFALTRIRASDGTLDGTFSGGKVTTDRGGVEQANAVAIQSDNKIVVAGISGPPGDFNWAVARYSAIDGSPDRPGRPTAGARRTSAPPRSMRTTSRSSPTGRSWSRGPPTRGSRSPATTRTARSTRPSRATASRRRRSAARATSPRVSPCSPTAGSSSAAIRSAAAA